MLKRVDTSILSASDTESDIPKSTGPIDFELLLAAARRQMRVLVVAALGGLLLGLAYIITAVPLYTATTNLLIDSQKDKSVVSSIADLTFDTGAIDSQVEVLKSERIALSVISTLKLTSDPEFMGTRGTLIGQAMGMLRSSLDFSRWFVTRDKSDPEDQFEIQRAALSQLKAGLDVRRVARTYVLAIDYTSPNPDK